MAKRKLTPAQRAVALKNLAKARRARKAKSAPKRRKRRSKPLTARRRRALGYHKERPMAKRRRASKKRRGGGRRRSGGGFFAGIEWKDMAGAAAYGMAEKQVAEKGDEAILKKVPLFYEGIGYAGCLGILAHFAGKQMGGGIGQALRHLAKGSLDVAAYKLAKNGKLYADKAEAEAALAGDGDDDMGWDDEVGIDLESDLLGDDEEVGYGADGIS